MLEILLTSFRGCSIWHRQEAFDKSVESHLHAKWHGTKIYWQEPTVMMQSHCAFGDRLLQVQNLLCALERIFSHPLWPATYCASAPSQKLKIWLTTTNAGRANLMYLSRENECFCITTIGAASASNFGKCENPISVFLTACDTSIGLSVAIHLELIC